MPAAAAALVCPLDGGGFAACWSSYAKGIKISGRARGGRDRDERRAAHRAPLRDAIASGAGTAYAGPLISEPRRRGKSARPSSPRRTARTTATALALEEPSAVRGPGSPRRGAGASGARRAASATHAARRPARSRPRGGSARRRSSHAKVQRFRSCRLPSGARRAALGPASTVRSLRFSQLRLFFALSPPGKGRDVDGDTFCEVPPFFLA